MQTIDYLVLGAYFAVMIGIGLVVMRGVHDQEDYFLGGRGFGKLLQTFAAFGAGTGAHEPIQVGRTVWTSGLSGVWSALMWLFVTPIYWITGVWYRRMRHLTLGDWFVERYQSPAMGAAYTLFAITFYMVYLSIMFSAIAKFAVPLMGIETGLFGYDLKFTLIPAIAAVVIVYGVLGGLAAAYWTDLIQGLFIILLSVLLVPYGLWTLVERFGTPEREGLLDGFQIMHQRVSAEYFQLFAGPSSGEFTLAYIISLSLLGLVGIVVQPHFIATGGGSAKSEDEARIGLVVGNFLKRLCTVGWALTALIALALFADNTELAADPDQVWGIAAREILGPLKLGLVGLMLACLLAAMMSCADAFMIVTSALVVRNIYAAFVNRDADEKQYLLVGRLTGLVLITGAAIFALWYADVFEQFKVAMELPILFAAPFWLGMYWRRANRKAVWGTICISLLLFFVLPVAIPLAVPSLRTDPSLATTTHIVTKTYQRPATEVDVERYQAWQTANQRSTQMPPAATDVGQTLTITTPPSGGQAVFWRGGTQPAEGGEAGHALVREYSEGDQTVRIERVTGPVQGLGALNLDFILYRAAGVDLSTASRGTLEALRLPMRLVLPFAVLLFLSFVTKRDDQTTLDRFYAKMNTPVIAEPEADLRALKLAYENPRQACQRKLFPDSDWEFVVPTAKDVIGFVVCCGICVGIIWLLVWLTGIGG